MGSNPLLVNTSKEQINFIEEINADKLLYDYAMKLCQAAALKELVGDLESVSY